jgi:hypothetical protein
MSVRRAWIAGIAGVVVGAVLSGGIVYAVATAPAVNAQATLCVGKGGSPRLVAPAASCKKGETKTSLGWVARGTWSATTTYTPGSLVLRPAGSFVARLASKGKTP